MPLLWNPMVRHKLTLTPQTGWERTAVLVARIAQNAGAKTAS